MDNLIYSKILKYLPIVSGIFLALTILLVFTTDKNRPKYINVKKNISKQWVKETTNSYTSKKGLVNNILEVTLISHKDSPSSVERVSIDNIRRISAGFPTKVLNNHCPCYKIILTKDGIKIKEQEISFNHYTEMPPPADGHISSSQVFISDSTQVINFAISPEVNRVGLIDPSGDQIIDQGLPVLDTIQPSAEFYTSQVANINNTAPLLDITFLSDKFTDFDLFHSKVEAFKNKLLEFEPFKSRASQISFHYFDNNLDLGCTYEDDRGIRCDISTIMQVISNSGLPADNIAVLHFDDPSKYCGSVNEIGGGISAICANNINSASTFVHEIGHSLGGLYDEYTYGTDGIIDNQPHKNCYAGTPPAAQWNGVVANGDYGSNCSYYNWATSSKGSIMSFYSYLYFNKISQDYINSAIDNFVGPAPSSSPPILSIISPINNGNLTSSAVFESQGVDDLGIVRVELWIDNDLFGTVYRPDLDNKFRHYFDTTKYQNGAYNLTFKAFDVTGNVDVKNVTVNIRNDYTPPTISIISPQNNEKLDGTVKIEINAQDDTTINEVKLYYNTTFIGKATTASQPDQPYKFDWNVENIPEGNYNFRVVATDVFGKSTTQTLPIEIKRALCITSNPTEAIKGKTMRFYLTYTNYKTTRMKTIMFRNDIPAQTTYILKSASNSGFYEPSQNSLTWRLTNILPGQSVTVFYDVMVN